MTHQPYSGRHRRSETQHPAVRVPPRSVSVRRAWPSLLVATLVLTTAGSRARTNDHEIKTTPLPVYASHAERVAHTANHAEERSEAQAKAEAVLVRVAADRQAARSRQRAAIARSQADAAAAAARRALVQAQVKEKAQVKAQAQAQAQVKAQAKREQQSQWALPIEGAVFTSGFGYRWGRMHQGDDFGAPVGTSLSAMSNGQVIAAGAAGAYGNKVEIRYTDGTVSVYAHMSLVSVSVGQRVATGERVGSTGNSGRSTGPHLHLEIHPDGGAPVDPSRWLTAKGLQT